VSCNQVVIFFGQFSFQLFHALFLKLNNLSAAQTTKVAVVFMTIDVFVVEVAILIVGFLNQAGFQKMWYQAIYGRF
jgi:hypothetical protein